MDSRMDLRLPIRLPVQVVTANGTVGGVTADLSFGGAYICLHPHWLDNLALHQPIRLQFEPAATCVDVPAVVTRRDGRGLGLVFGDYTAHADDYITGQITRFFTPQT